MTVMSVADQLQLVGLVVSDRSNRYDPNVDHVGHGSVSFVSCITSFEMSDRSCFCTACSRMLPLSHGAAMLGIALALKVAWQSTDGCKSETFATLSHPEDNNSMSC